MYCAVSHVEIYPMDSVIHPSNNRYPLFSNLFLVTLCFKKQTAEPWVWRVASYLTPRSLLRLNTALHTQHGMDGLILERVEGFAVAGWHGIATTTSGYRWTLSGQFLLVK